MRVLLRVAALISGMLLSSRHVRIRIPHIRGGGGGGIAASMHLVKQNGDSASQNSSTWNIHHFL